MKTMTALPHTSFAYFHQNLYLFRTFPLECFIEQNRIANGQNINALFLILSSKFLQKSVLRIW
jgi:hypothetical protein